MLAYGIHSLITVPLRAGSLVLGVANFWRAEKPQPFDTEDWPSRRSWWRGRPCRSDNARRYTREHSMAVTLQRSLLPRSLPEQGALEIAYRYLPAQAGVGGDWFDVLPLSGARVALVVGDVVGHGLHAAATMGRLRTAVHNFSSLDLPRTNSSGLLDELVGRIDQDETPATRRGRGDGRDLSVRDLRPGDPAVHDGAGRASAAALVRPDGEVEFLDLPAGPPLGLGGLPFETAELELPRTAGWCCTPTVWWRTGSGTWTRGSACCATPCAGRRAPPRGHLPYRAGPAAGPASDDVALIVARTGAGRRPGRTVAGAHRPGGRVGGAGLGDPAAGRLGSGGAGVHDGADPERVGHQRHPLRSRPDRGPAAAGPHADLRGVRQQRPRRICGTRRAPTRAAGACSWSPSSLERWGTGTPHTAR